MIRGPALNRPDDTNLDNRIWLTSIRQFGFSSQNWIRLKDDVEIRQFSIIFWLNLSIFDHFFVKLIKRSKIIVKMLIKWSKMLKSIENDKLNRKWWRTCQSHVASIIFWLNSNSDSISASTFVSILLDPLYRTPNWNWKIVSSGLSGQVRLG